MYFFFFLRITVGMALCILLNIFNGKSLGDNENELSRKIFLKKFLVDYDILLSVLTHSQFFGF